MPDEQKSNSPQDNPTPPNFGQSGEPALASDPELARVESEVKMPEVPSVDDISVASETPVNSAAEESVKPSMTPSSIPEFSPETEASEAPAKTPKKQKKWLVAAVVAGAVVLLGGGGAAAYTFWYQNPEKVLGDAFANALQAKSATVTGTINMKGDSSGSETTIEMTAKGDMSQGEVNVTLSVKESDQTIKVTGSGVYDKDGNLYIKVNDLAKNIDTLGGSSINEMFGSVVQKLDGKWLKIAATDLKNVSEDYSKVQTCVTAVQNKFATNKSARDEIVAAYQNNKFVVVKENLGTKDGSLGYVIDADQVKVKSFVAALNETTLVKDLVKCDSTLAFNTDDITSDSTDATATPRVEVWVTQFTHQFSKLSLSDTSDGTTTSMVLQPTFNSNVTVTVPTEVIPLSELQADIEAAYQKWFTEMMGSDDFSTFDMSEASLLDI